MNDYRPTNFEDKLKRILKGLDELNEQDDATVEKIDAMLLDVLEAPVPERNITNAAKLLSDIAEGLKELENGHRDKIEKLGHMNAGSIKLEHVGVTFYEGGGDTGTVVWDGGLATALDFLSNDTYWDENRDWAGADAASVSYG